MAAWVLTALTWLLECARDLKGTFNSQDHTLELQEIGFALVVGFGVYWLTVTLHKPLEPSWVSAFGILAGLVTLKNVAGAYGSRPGGC